MSSSILDLPPAGSSLAALEDARALLESRRDALAEKDYGPADPERAPVEEALAALQERIDAALEEQARSAREAELAGRRAAAQRAVDRQALKDLKQAVERRVASLDGTWIDGAFAERRKTIADAQKRLEECTDAASLAKAKELRGDIYDAADWIERNTPARTGLKEREDALDALAKDCAAADAASLAAVSLRKAERARTEMEKKRDKGLFEEAAAGCAAAKALYEQARTEARAAKAAAEVESAGIYKDGRLWEQCLAAAEKALEWDPDNEAAKALKNEAHAAKADDLVAEALEYKRKGLWDKCLASAEAALAWRKDNAEALALGSEAKAEMKKSADAKASADRRKTEQEAAGLLRKAEKRVLRVSATVNGSPAPGAVLMIGGVRHVLPKDFDLSEIVAFGPASVEFFRNGFPYRGTLGIQQGGWTGVRSIAVPLSRGHAIEDGAAGTSAPKPNPYATEGRNGATRETPARTVRSSASPVAKANKEVSIDLGGGTWFTKGVVLEMVLCPGAGVAPDFWMGKYEVTQEQWERVMGGNPSHFKGPKKPVESVSWNECQAFVRKLNALPFSQRKGLTFRLPTATEWEAACLAGASPEMGYCRLKDGTQITSSSLFRVARFGKNWSAGPVDVGLLEPNAWGLYDMHGNVWEWNATGSNPYENRGGGFYSTASRCSTRHQDRDRNISTYSSASLGFRLAASP